MPKYLVDSSQLIAIADAIRNKTGSTLNMTVGDMPQNITSIETGSANIETYSFNTDDSVEDGLLCIPKPNSFKTLISIFVYYHQEKGFSNDDYIIFYYYNDIANFCYTGNYDFNNDHAYYHIGSAPTILSNEFQIDPVDNSTSWNPTRNAYTVILTYIPTT